MKKGFTLAEILIVLTVIGVLTAILLPIAFNSAPDENVMKFKKANANLGRAIYELVNSDKYYQDGDLAYKADGTLLDGSDDSHLTYFCETLADILSVKSVDCSTRNNPSLTGFDDLGRTTYYGYSDDKMEGLKHMVDSACLAHASKGNEQFITADNVYWYELTITSPFASTFSADNINAKDDNGFDAAYKTFCIDIDGIDKGEDPFGYGIRHDGKIIPGERADEWVEKSIQRGDD